MAWPIVAALGVSMIGGAISSYQNNKAQQRAARDANKAALNQAKQTETERAAYQKQLEQQAAAANAANQKILDAGDMNHRIAQAGNMYQAANNAEVNAAIQGGLAAYGGSPLSGNARQAVYGNLATQARNNWQTALSNANSMMNQDTQNALGARQGIDSALMSGGLGLGQQAMGQNFNTGTEMMNLAAVPKQPSFSIGNMISQGLQAYGALK